MDQNIKDLIDAIVDENSVNSEKIFNGIMADKLADKIDTYRQDVANSFFNPVEEVEEVVEEEWDDERITQELESLTEQDLEGLTTEELEALAEAVRVYDISKSNSGTKPKTPEERNKAAAAVKAARANKPKDNYTGKSVTGAGSAGAGARQAGKSPSHIAVKE